MTYKIIWSPLAKTTYLKVLEYVLIKWNRKEVIKVEKLVNNKIKSLENNQFLCPASIKNKNIRRCVISKQTSLIYEVKNGNIELLLFIDNRMDNKI